jgi:hypothetical protein
MTAQIIVNVQAHSVEKYCYDVSDSREWRSVNLHRTCMHLLSNGLNETSSAKIPTVIT